MASIKSRVKFFGPGTPEELEEEINGWFDEQDKWFRVTEATSARHTGVAIDTRIIMAVFYEELVPCKDEDSPRVAGSSPHEKAGGGGEGRK
jgi:hypothetical protein